MSLRKEIRRALVHMGSTLFLHGALFAVLLFAKPESGRKS